MSIEQKLTKMIDDLDATITPQATIAKVVRLLTYIRDEAIGIEYSSESTIHGILNKVIGD